ncbi:LOW QUALITY PROTEIN: hypothetical protein V2J09_008729 [Rumex salicifolius]
MRQHPEVGPTADLVISLLVKRGTGGQEALDLRASYHPSRPISLPLIWHARRALADIVDEDVLPPGMQLPPFHDDLVVGKWGPRHYRTVPRRSGRALRGYVVSSHALGLHFISGPIRNEGDRDYWRWSSTMMVTLGESLALTYLYRDLGKASHAGSTVLGLHVLPCIPRSCLEEPRGHAGQLSSSV